MYLSEVIEEETGEEENEGTGKLISLAELSEMKGNSYLFNTMFM